MRNLADTLYAQKAIETVNRGQIAFCKFLSANDTGLTGGHQSGIYITKSARTIIFDEPGVKGKNKKSPLVKIHWQDRFTTDSVFTYYGTGTRNEYRITKFGRGFEFLQKEHTGDLFVFVKLDQEEYAAYVLSTEDEIETFLNAFALSPADTGGLIQKISCSSEEMINREMDCFINSLATDFPSSDIMSATSRKIYHHVYNYIENITKNPDKQIVEWINMEYQLFRRIEENRYAGMIKAGFSSVDEFISVANQALNRRKSRAGKSLEHHLAAIFDGNKIPYAAQAKSEGNKKPDFLFPSHDAYHNKDYPESKLIFLGAKTTCKDRWRQIINEANRISKKHLFTLQQGVSPQQMAEMTEENVILVVPKPYIKAYPPEYQESIMPLHKFIEYIKEKTAG